MHNFHPFFGTRRSRSRTVAAAVLVIGALSLAACGSSGTATPDEDVPQVLTLGLSGEPQPMKAAINQNALGYLMDALLQQGLLRWGEGGEIEPALAESFEQVDNATYTFTLRPDLKFSDGTPLTSADVKRTFEYLADPANAAFTVAGMSRISEITTEGDSQLTVKLKENDPDFLGYVANPTAFIVKEDALSPNATVTVGAGPFVIEDQTQGVGMDLVPNEHFYDPESVTLDRIEAEYYFDATARVNALISGDVDFIDFVPTQDFERLESTPGVVVAAEPSPMIGLTFNTTSGPFANPLVRTAIAYAIDREHVASAADGGKADPVYGVMLGEDSEFASDESGSLYSYDPEKAKELLAEAGYPDGFDATILTMSQYLYHQDTAVAVQNDLKEVGINLTLDSGDQPTWVRKAIAGEYEVKTTGVAGLIPQASYLESLYFANAAYTSFGYDNPELREALTEGRTAETDEERAEAYDRAFDIVAEDTPRVDLTQRYNGYAFKDTVQGFENWPGFLSQYSQNWVPYLSIASE
ncbi:hypothetical protein JNB62_05115 [Microbacterium jejuense]|uniref:Solute-binding protein family 5 domain-containing protein n=1 Tax=Microbacterium jejuense TaxID=1263637 RepID=A0ABS7HKU7_9MICO|nr:ABC transporter substrate-binding protein [Microbacterium jejuense]MBW9093055.1 hypothetical protein [Microbacterium jejuense]